MPNTKTQEYLRDGRAPIPKNETVSKVMSSNSGKNTKPELIFRKYLWHSGEKGYRIHPKDVPGRPDIAYIGDKIAVFVNGCFWHRCPHCDPSVPKSNTDFWERKFKMNKERDRRKSEELRTNDWEVFVVWECQINNQSQHLEKVKEEIRNLRSSNQNV